MEINNDVYYTTFIFCLSCRREMQDETESNGHKAFKHVVEIYKSVPSDRVKKKQSEEIGE